MGNISSCIKNIIQNAKSKSFNKEELKNIVSEELYSHIKRATFKNNNLFVYIDSTPALYEFKLRRNEILNVVNNKNKKIKKIIFKLGS